LSTLAEWFNTTLSLLKNDLGAWTTENIFSGDAFDWGVTAATSFVLIGAAEIGDKSQIVCMTLAARYRGLPIFLGAASAFAVLNLAAVLFGATVAAWLPDYLIAIGVAILFTVFGIHALRVEEDNDDAVVQKSGHGVFITTFVMILVAEFGDKTQIAVAGLSSTAIPASVWLGATLALATTSALGIWAGRILLRRISMQLLHKISGTVFLLLAGFTLIHAFGITLWARGKDFFTTTF